MTEEHQCTEECIGELEGIVAQLQAEHQQDLGRIQELEDVLRRIHRECFENLSAPKVLRHRALALVAQACETVVEIPNFGAALSPSEASQKDRCQCQSGSSALGQCKLEVGHTEDCAFEFAEAPEKEEE